MAALLSPLLLLPMLFLLAATAPPRTIEPPAAPAAHASPAESTTIDTVRVGGTKVCHNSTPCGWAVYNGYSRTMLYFVQNTCECSPGRQCTRVEDDLSARAFVYRCTPAANEATITPPSSPPSTDRRR
ncbi:uncharacterized protein LOC124159599 [Ischnura elegans]|uniref:uncharacterized protein LOC124159599 n=1 Tax=Ischnura elegans TaxID=197161 RepID=UPI001ED86648|nr:uncharacterized protein LOC124159599 [Ischnura elegans]